MSGFQAEEPTIHPVRIADTEDERQYYLSQWQLMWIKFRRHKLAMVASVVLILLYTGAILAPFLSPLDPREKNLEYRESPPTRIRVLENGRLFRPFVYGVITTKDRETYKRTFAEDTSVRFPVRYFVRGFPYKLLGLIETEIHLFGTGEETVRIHLFGADQLGRDVFSKILYGSQISLTVGLVGVIISFVMGIIIGGISGYFGGVVDEIIQRFRELLMSIPKLPLWMGLSAALPTGWPVVRTYFAITIILSLVGWTGLAREVRGKFLSLREEDYVMAAKLAGCTNIRIILKHMVPAFLSHIVASLTLSIPWMILGETSLSFLGLGMQAPAISWGVLLKEGQNVHTLALTPWLMIPGIFVIITVLAINFLGDGLRDAADPYA